MIEELDISHTHSCKPTFAPPCILVLKYKPKITQFITNHIKVYSISHVSSKFDHKIWLENTIIKITLVETCFTENKLEVISFH